MEGGINRLPEGCISHVISLTSPHDSCRLALVSSTFRSAGKSDTVWERFLPHDYPQILARAVHPVCFSNKRDLYFALCDPILIDGGKMSFALERSSGRKCYTQSARELGIAWGDNPQYWRWIPLIDSRFAEVAELLRVCWLEISGKINSEVLSPNTTYTAYLLFKLVNTSYGLDLPNQETLVRVGTRECRFKVCLQPDEAEAQQSQRMLRSPRGRDDGWMEIELGDFLIDDGNDGEVDISFLDRNGMQWKSGLIIQGIEVKPKK